MTIPGSATDTVLNLYKRKSETPLQAVERYVKAHPGFKGAKMTYAGRLDPMAEGVLIVLSGEKNKEREKYTGLDKEYEFEFILGVETDTFDALGKVVSAADAGSADERAVAAALKAYEGKVEQAYPPFSSKVVNGTPLFELARKGKLAGLELPKHAVRADEIELRGTRNVSRADLRAQIERDIRAVEGDFRQEEILALWEGYFSQAGREAYTVFKARVACGSGFYVRQLVSDVGKRLGTGAVTMSILRTRVGEYRLEDSER